ncbi:MAG: outer-membrane lipoprotein carrier protein LolA [Phycisphaerae bacterium]|nr:outer-membrane lipoprotein carrier protein LolA [Phycisphaerae bacterium]
MKNKIGLLIFSCVLLFLQWNCPAGETDGSNALINDIIEKLNQTAINLKNLSAKIEYIHAQPLFETQTVRNGKVFYTKDINCCALRINFMTMKQDDAAQQNYREDYIFDGWKMTKIDYQSKSAASEQLAKEKPIEPFELVQSYFPIIGFARPAELAEQFDIKIQENKRNLVTLLLIPKETSGFSKTYKQVEIKIDPKNFLPFDFSAVTIEDEKITIKLTQIDTKSEVKKDVFGVVIPADFVMSEKRADAND